MKNLIILTTIILATFLSCQNSPEIDNNRQPFIVNKIEKMRTQPNMAVYTGDVFYIIAPTDIFNIGDTIHVCK